MMNPEGLAEGKSHMIVNYILILFSFAELASSVVIVVNRVGFISHFLFPLYSFAPSVPLGVLPELVI